MNKCPICSNPLNYVPQYQQWYCYNCRDYKVPVAVQPVQTYPPPPPPMQSAPAGVQCPNCHSMGTYVPSYNQHYCQRCGVYIQQQPQHHNAPQPQQPQPTASIPPAQEYSHPGNASEGYASTNPPRDINLGIVTHVLEKGTTLFDKSRNSVCYLPDERVQNLGTVSLERDMTQYNMTHFKGELFLTQYRMVFVEKARFLDPSWMSFWFNVDFEGRTFQADSGPGMCRGMYLEMEPKQLSRSIDMRMRYVQADGGLLPQGLLSHPVKLYKLDMLQMLTQARDTALPVKASVLHDHIQRVLDPSGIYTFGLWDSALERAMRQR